MCAIRRGWRGADEYPGHLPPPGHDAGGGGAYLGAVEHRQEIGRKQIEGENDMVATTRSVSSDAKAVVGSATVALVGVAYFAAVIVGLHFLQPDQNPLRQPTSEYAVGPYGWLMTTAFLSMSAASWALVAGLARGLPRAARSRAGLGLLALWSTGLLVAMLFPIDLDGAAPTLAGTIHRINGPITFLSLSLGTVLVSRRLKQAAAWRPVYRLALPLALLMLVEFVV